jgi:hypothetical protein
MNKLLKLISIFPLIIIAFLSCKNTGTHLSDRDLLLSERHEVEQRFYEYMGYRRSDDIKKMYEMLDPDFRQNISYEKFKEMPKEVTIGLLSYYVETVEFAKADVAYLWYSEYVHPMSLPTNLLHQDLKTTWLKIDNVWYLQHEAEAAKPSVYMCGNNAMPQSENPTPSAPKACGS